MRLTVLLTLLLFTFSHSRITSPLFSNPAYSQNFAQDYTPFPEFVKALGYPAETHTITTEDGYILTYFRIQAKGQSLMKPDLPVIYLQHGLMDSGDTWVIDNESNAPGLQLADQGYDVWVGNNRGTKYSIAHVSLDPKKAEFWQFSWQNMSHYDLPAAFQYIYDATGQNITYIGHSQGATIMFGALSDQEPVVLKYLNKFIGLSAVAWVSHIQSGPIKWMANSELMVWFKTFKVNTFMQPDFFDSEMGHAFCKLFPDVCGNLLSEIYGADPRYDNYNEINQILLHEPGGTSTMNMYHWRQMILNGRFCKYDYGMEENMKQYGQPSPPDYNVSSITIPVHLFFGQYDTILSEQDTTILLDNLSGSKVDYNVYPANHITWIWSKDINFYWGNFLNLLKE